MSEAEFAILGAGAMGSIVGAHLARAGHSVVMLARGRRADQVGKAGLAIRGLAEFTVPVRTVSEPSSFAGAGTLIVAVKTPGTALALAALRHAQFDLTLSIQNGPLMNDLVRDGKIRYYGFSDTPAWYVARAQTLAEKEGKERLIALQLEYSLVERNIEREHIPAAQQLGIALCPWSPLAGGFLTGKYTREGNSGKGVGRLETTKTSGNPAFNKFSERNWQISDALVAVAKQINKSPAQVALNWVITQPGVTSTIIGATKISQLNDNLQTAEISIPPDLRKRLDEVSAPEAIHPYIFFSGGIQDMVNGGTSVKSWESASITGAPPANPKASAATEK
jgi:diketogulonate reductase-like aldo/keto reductase